MERPDMTFLSRDPDLYDTKTTANVVYEAWVAPNSDSANLKQCVIRKTDLANETRKFAGGNLHFDKDWSQRASLTYKYLTSPKVL